jgi:hypothetical protein
MLSFPLEYFGIFDAKDLDSLLFEMDFLGPDFMSESICFSLSMHTGKHTPLTTLNSRCCSSIKACAMFRIQKKICYTSPV